jgi:hypothetical protein
MIRKKNKKNIQALEEKTQPLGEIYPRPSVYIRSKNIPFQSVLTADYADKNDFFLQGGWTGKL